MEQMGFEQWIENENTSKSACEWGSIPMKWTKQREVITSDFKTMDKNSGDSIKLPIQWSLWTGVSRENHTLRLKSQAQVFGPSHNRNDISIELMRLEFFEYLLDSFVSVSILLVICFYCAFMIGRSLFIIHLYIGLAIPSHCDNLCTFFFFLQPDSMGSWQRLYKEPCCFFLCNHSNCLQIKKKKNKLI